MRYDVCPPLFEELFSSFPETGMREEKQMKKEIITASLAALVLTGGAFTVRAEGQPVYTLDGIVVTASRTPEKKIDTNADISVVTAKEIAEKHYSDVAQAVKSVPGVFVNSHGVSSQTTNSDQVYINGSPNVVLLVDGMRRNTNGNSLMNASIGELVAMDSIERIEVLKGSASTLYGSDAQGGVINIITKKPATDQVKTTLRASLGSYDKEKYNLYNEGKAGDFFWSLEAGKELQGEYKDGWGRKVINHLNAKHLNLKLGYDLGEDSSVVVNYEKYKADYTMPNSGTNDKTPAPGKKDNDSISLQYKAKLSDRLSNQFSIYRNRTTFDLPTMPWAMKMKTTGISDQLTYTGNKQTITGGFDWYKDEVPYYLGESTQGKSATNTAFYIQDKIDLTDQWNITPGVRVDHHSEFGTHTSPSLSIGYKQSENTNYYLNYKTFFVAPNLYQLFSGSYGYFSGNKDLEPSEGNTIEFGINHKFSDSLTGTFNVFHTHAKNLIQYSYATNRFENTGKTNVNGFSVSLDKEFSQHWNASVGYTFIHSPATSEGANINSNGIIPESTLNLQVGYRTTDFNATLSGRGVMNRYGNKSSTAMRDYANYWVWDLAANYQFTENATLFARVNNIFDQFYTDVGSSYGPMADPRQYQYWYSAPGRNFEVGLQFQF